MTFNVLSGTLNPTHSFMMKMMMTMMKLPILAFAEKTRKLVSSIAPETMN